ncbi:rab-GTPase-TBC domain-containing protein [Mortierella sp. GBAus27b]|nr:rab-GTPase-TBC domain-containing protein [Mortierella sp. GBAus27b]
MRTATPGFESTLQHQLLDPTTGSLLDSAATAEQQQHRLRNRLQRIVKIPPSVAQTHTRMSPIKLGINRVDKRKLAISTPPFKSTPVTATNHHSKDPNDDHSLFLKTTTSAEPDSADQQSLPRQSSNINRKSKRDSNSSSSTKHGNDADDDDSDIDQGQGKPSAMGPREGYTFSYSLFARVKARVLHNNPSQNQRQQQQQLHPVTGHPNEKSNSSSQESGASKVSSSDATEVESDGSNACTLSGGTSGNMSDNADHDILTHGNDSDGTVTDLDGPTNCLRQRKYSFGSRHNSVTPDDTEACTSALVPLVGPTPTEKVTAEVIADDMDDDVAEEEDLDDDEDPIERFEEILGRQHQSEEAIAASLQELRQLILAYGIPEQPAATSKSSSIRCRCWKLLLEVHHVSAQEYVSLVKRGKPEEYGKIRNDTFRTMATDRKYLDEVEEDSLIRVLCAFAWSTQGMNVLAAPFLFTMSEMEAFYAYSNLLKHCCPLYVQPTLAGVHCGIKLLEECLCKIDPELYDYLKSKSMSAEVYALSSMQLWDFLLAWGIHLNIICIIAQLYLIRDELMSPTRPMKLNARNFPPLNADKIIRETIRMVKLLPDELYDLLVRHPYDPTVAEQIGW